MVLYAFLASPGWAVQPACPAEVASRGGATPATSLPGAVSDLARSGALQDRGTQVTLTDSLSDITARTLGPGAAEVQVSFTDSGDGDSPGGKGGSGDGESSNPGGNVGGGETPGSLLETEPRSRCVVRGLIRVGVSVVANGLGAYAPNAKMYGGKDPHWLERGPGITWPSNYYKAWQMDTDFRYNNVWNVVLMLGVEASRCIKKKHVGTLLVAALAAATSTSSQLALRGEIKLRDLAYDVGFILGLTLPRSILVGAIDKHALIKFAPSRRNSYLAGINLVDQWAGGWLYALGQWWVPTWWPKSLDRTLPRSAFPVWFQKYLPRNAGVQVAKEP